MATSEGSDEGLRGSLPPLDRGELREVTETGIVYLLSGKFSEYTKNETIATVLASLHDRITKLEDAAP